MKYAKSHHLLFIFLGVLGVLIIIAQVEPVILGQSSPLIVFFVGVIAYVHGEKHEEENCFQKLRNKQDYIDFLEETYAPNEDVRDEAYEKWLNKEIDAD